MAKKILVVASHPDDEVLGCGGTIVKEVQKGNEVKVVFISDGVTSRDEFNESQLKQRIRASKEAQSILGIQSLEYLNFQDNKLDSYNLLDIVKKIEEIIKAYEPTTVYTHHFGDLNIDHRLTHEAVMTACRPIPNTTVNEIFGFEVLSSTEWTTPQKSIFNPTLFINISEFFDIKMQAFSAYSDEIRKAPHSRSIKHIEILAQHRGYCVGIDFAEAFEVYRIIE